MPFPRSFPFLVDFAAGTGTQTKTVNLPIDCRVVSVTATTPSAVATGTLNIDVTVAGTSVFAAANDKPRIAIAATAAVTGTTNADYRAVATATSTVKGSTYAVQNQNPAGDLTGKWTSATPATVATVQGQALAVTLSGSYASVACQVVLELERV